MQDKILLRCDWWVMTKFLVARKVWIFQNRLHKFRRKHGQNLLALLPFFTSARLLGSGIQCGAFITQSLLSKFNTKHSTACPNTYGLSIVGSKSHLHSVSVSALMCAISCYIGQHYNGTRLYEEPCWTMFYSTVHDFAGWYKSMELYNRAHCYTCSSMYSFPIDKENWARFGGYQK